jgi:rhodanese-related sulfurtransferase
MTIDERPEDPRIPAVGTVSPAERMYRINWLAAELRSPSGVPLLSPEDVARLGHAARLVDVRRPDELVGPHGYIPGSDWLPLERAKDILAGRHADEPIVLISRGGERAGDIAKDLERQGKRFVAAMMGGVVAWRQVGFAVTREKAILDREAQIGAPRTKAFEAQKRALSCDDVAEHLGDASSIHWVKLAAILVSGHLSCVDGRDGSGVIGTPGGDAGELLVTLAALEQATGRRIDDAELRELLLCRLDAFGRLYLHTDVHASNALIAALRADRRLDDALKGVFHPLEWRKFMASPPEAVRPVLLEHMLRPEHLGCGHLRLSLQRSNDYGVRPELVESFLRQFFTLRWEGVAEHAVAVLPGGHAEGAVVNIMLEDDAEAFSHVPLVSPMAGGSQMFLQHPQVATYLRNQLVRFLAQYEEVNVPALEARLAELAGIQLGHTLKALASGLPIYETLLTRSQVKVTERGRVP